MAPSPRFQPVSFAALPGWRADPCLPAFEAFRRSAEQARAKPYKTGALVDGDAETVAEVNDLWTFARDIRSRDPNWKLIATESEG